MEQLDNMTLEEQHKYWKDKEEEAWQKYRLAKVKEVFAWERLADALHDLAEAIEKPKSPPNTPS